MTDQEATEALAVSLREVLNKDEWFALVQADALYWAARMRRRLRAKGFDVVQVPRVSRDAANKLGEALG